MSTVSSSGFGGVGAIGTAVRSREIPSFVPALAVGLSLIVVGLAVPTFRKIPHVHRLVQSDGVGQFVEQRTNQRRAERGVPVISTLRMALNVASLGFVSIGCERRS